MKFLEYILFRIFKGLFAIVPFSIIYFISDVCSLLMQYVIRYRHKTIVANLKNAFPLKSEHFIKQITREYYMFLCDLFLESLKGYSLGTNQLLRRYKCLNPEITHTYFEKGQSIIIALAHYGNWEWGTQVASSIYKHKVSTFYKPLSNKYIDDYLQKLRKSRDMELLSIYQIHRLFRKKGERPKAYFMVSDQSPSMSEKVIWTRFLNQDTACLRGIENYAILFDLPVIYLDVQRIKRGFYTIEMKEICTNPAIFPKGEITQIFMTKLESIIFERPEYWLWSHRRWKITRIANENKKMKIDDLY